MEIRVNGQPLTGSPWVVQVGPPQYQFAFQFGSTGKEQGEFDGLWEIAVSEKTGTIALADIGNKRIQMFSCDGNFLREIALNSEPSSLAFTVAGDVLASSPDDDNNLSLFTEGSQFIRHINHSHLKYPLHLSVGSDGRIITCDLGDKNIKVLSPDGKDLLLSFSAPGCDSIPCCAVYHQEKFFVPCNNAHCVKVFNNAGVYLYDIGSEGSGDGQLLFPIGLAFDKSNRLIACDPGNKRLQLFTLEGTFDTKVEGQFFDSTGLRYIATSSSGHLFVTDYNKNCIYVFR